MNTVGRTVVLDILHDNNLDNYLCSVSNQAHKSLGDYHNRLEMKHGRSILFCGCFGQVVTYCHSSTEDL